MQVQLIPMHESQPVPGRQTFVPDGTVQGNIIIIMGFATKGCRDARAIWLGGMQVLRKLRRCPWAQSEAYLVKCLLRTVKGSFSHIAITASITASLSRYHPSLSVALADCLLEEVPLPALQYCPML